MFQGCQEIFMVNNLIAKIILKKKGCQKRKKNLICDDCVSIINNLFTKFTTYDFRLFPMLTTYFHVYNLFPS